MEGFVLNILKESLILHFLQDTLNREEQAESNKNGRNDEANDADVEFRACGNKLEVVRGLSGEKKEDDGQDKNDRADAVEGHAVREEVPSSLDFGMGRRRKGLDFPFVDIMMNEMATTRTDIFYLGILVDLSLIKGGGEFFTFDFPLVNLLSTMTAIHSYTS